MALTNATLTVKLVESLTLNGNNYGGTITKTFTVDEIFKRIVLCPGSADTTVVTFNAAVSGADGAIDEDFPEYLRITNLDGTNSVNLGFVGDASNFQVLLGAGETYIMGAVKAGMKGEADTSPAFSLEDMVKIIADPGANAVELEIFIAGKSS